MSLKRLHAGFRRQTRRRGRDAFAVLMLFVAGIGTALVILSQQNTSLPGWVPIYGEDVVKLEAELDTAQGVTPGQGQAVTVSGIQVGLIDSVALEDGVAVVSMKVDGEHAEIIREDASVLLRPRTNLNDMVLELEPGTADEPIEPGTRITLENTKPNVQFDEFLAALDGDTRAYLKLLLQAGARGLDGRGEELSAGFRRFEPFTRFIAQLNGALAKRRKEMRNVVHNFRLLTEELSRNANDIRRFVSTSSVALEGFANRQNEIRDSLSEFPSTLKTTRTALDNANTYAEKARTTLTELLPQAESLGPGLEASRDLFKETLAPLRDQIRPFSRQVRPTTQLLSRGAEPLHQTIKHLGGGLNSLNYGFNELAYNPGADNPGFLFYLPWLNHNLVNNYFTEDGGGAYRRSILMISCRSARLADGFVNTRPFLKTVQESSNVPTGEEICP